MSSDERGEDALQSEADLSPADLSSGLDRRRFMMRSAVVTAAALIAGRSPLSARQVGFGYPFLPIYYLGALSIGYYSGYFLLVFGTENIKMRQRVIWRKNSWPNPTPRCAPSIKPGISAMVARR